MRCWRRSMRRSGNESRDDDSGGDNRRNTAHQQRLLERRRGPFQGSGRINQILYIWVAALMVWLCAARIGQARVPGPGPQASFDSPEAEGMQEQPDEPFDLWLEEPPNDCWDEPPSEASEDDVDNQRPAVSNYSVGDLGFQDHQLESWRIAEAEVGLKAGDAKQSAVAKAKAAAKKAKEQAAKPQWPNSIEGLDFFPLEDFVGRLPGWTFKTSDRGLGYHRESPVVKDRAKQQPIPLVLDSLIKPKDCNPDLMSKGSQPVGDLITMKSKRARRSRHPNGKRKSRPSRRKVANAAAKAGTNHHDCPDIGSLGERWWVPLGWWAVDSGNINSWKSGCETAIKKSKADVSCVQEARLHSADKLATAANEARRLGWNPILFPALKAGGNMSSGGGAVLARKGTAVKRVGQAVVPQQEEHRIGCAWVDAVVKGGVYFVNIYLKDGEGMSETNKHLLETAAQLIASLRGPWIAQGDWNLSPEVLAASNWLKITNGVIFATELATCNDNTYDYFVVHRELADSVRGVQRLQDGHLSPHWVTRLILSGDAKRCAVRQLVQPARVEGILPKGPPRPPADFGGALKALAKGEFGQATVQWYTAARQEWSDLASQDLTYKPCRFRWASAVTRSASPWDGSTAASTLWRNLAHRVKDIESLLTRSPFHPIHGKALIDHLKAAGNSAASLPKAIRAEHEQALNAWAASLHSAIKACSAHWMQSLKNLANTKAKALEAITENCRRTEWQVAIGAKAKPCATSNAVPTKLAYRWMRGPIGWQAPTEGPAQLNDCIPEEPDEEQHTWLEADPFEDQGEASDGEAAVMADQAAVELEANKWAKLWKEKEPYPNPVGAPPEEHFLDLMPEAIEEASETFPRNTALGADNVAPRAFARLSRPALMTLAAILMALERFGDWVEAVNLVIIVLLPKKSGGRRPIGLFPTLVRIWMRARILVARKWEAANAMPCIYGGPSMGAQKAAWQAAFDSEYAALVGTHHLQLLLDLVKAFETVPHDILAEAARKAGYNMAILRLTLAAYRLIRVLSIEGVFSRKVRATRGITAGSGFATGELRILLMDLMKALKAIWADRGLINLKLFVDDLTIAASGSPQWLVKLAIEVADFVVEWFESKLKMEVSDTKSKIISSSPVIAQAVAAGAKSKKLKTAEITQLLGTDTAGGRRRRTQTQQDRFSSFTSCRHRLQSLRKCGVNSLQMVRAAGPPAFLYGAETIGVSDTTLNNMRTAVASSIAYQAGGKNTDITLFAMDGAYGTTDPAFLAHSYPVQYWALAWWESWFTPEVMQVAFGEAAIKLAKAKGSWWSVVAGPAAAMLASVYRIGWEMPSASEAIDDIGQSWSFRLDSPAAIVKACNASVRRWRLARVCKAAGSLDAGRIEVPHTISDRSVLIDFAAVIGPLVRGKRCRTPPGVSWDPKWASMLNSAMNNGQWTQARKAQVASFEAGTNLCQLCLKEVGTLEHRYCCEATKPPGGWPSPPKAAKLMRSKLGEARRRTLHTRGLLAVRVPLPQARQDGWFHWLREPDCNNPAVNEATWYFDGSMQDGKYEVLRATGFGVAVVSPDGDLIGYGRGVPPQWCYTAAAAEAWALLEVLRNSATPPKMRTDCLSLLKTARAGAQLATAACRPLARIWVQISHVLDGDLSALERTNLLVWQPAHQSEQSIGQKRGSDGKKTTAVDWRANRLVDALAKSAAETVRAGKPTRYLLRSARVTCLHAACTLGRVTHAANNHKVDEVDEKGNTRTVTKRDSMDAPPRKPKTTAAKPPAEKPAPAAESEASKKKKLALERASQLLLEEPAAKRGRSAVSARNKRLREEDLERTRGIVEVRASQLRPTSTEPAATIMERLRKRVKLRCGIEQAPERF